MIIVTPFTITVKNLEEGSKQYIEPFKENVSFLMDYKCDVINNKLSKNELLNIKIEDYTINNPYYVVNPYINNKSILIMFITDDDSSIDVNIKSDDSITNMTFQESKKHIILINDLEVGNNNITLSDSNNNNYNFNVFINDTKDEINTIYNYDNKYIYSYYDEAGFLLSDYIYDQEYLLFDVNDNNILLLDNEFSITEKNNKNQIIKSINLNDYISLNDVSYMKYNVFNNSIDFIIDNKKYIYKDNELKEVEIFTYSNIYKNYVLKNYNRYDFSGVTFLSLNNDEINGLKNVSLMDYSINLDNNVIINDEHKNIIFLSSRGYGYKTKNAYINLNILPKGKYYLYLEDNLSYNINKCIEIK